MIDVNLIDAVKAAGVVGAGGAGFPTHVKLNTSAQCFIVNAAECEPLIETDKYLCRNFPDKIISAVFLVSKHLGANRAVIALKGKYAEEIASLKKAISKQDAAIEIFEMKNFYPAGDEQVMVNQVMKKTIPERGLPKDVGAVVDNVGTLLNIADALNEKAVTNKYLSVVGEVENPIMLSVPIGTSIMKCIENVKLTTNDYCVVLGGPMMGKILKTKEEMKEAVVTKTVGNIIILNSDHYLIRRSDMSLERIKRQALSACIQCRMCTDLCPRYLIGHKIRPNMIMRNIFREPFIDSDEEYAKVYGEALNCCDCGVCEMFSCPMGLSPRKINGYYKGELRKKGLEVPKNQDPKEREFANLRRVPTDRLVSRLGLSKYYGRHAKQCIEIVPDEVFIPFSQHIGKPAKAIVSTGDKIEVNQMVAAADESGLSANIHSGFAGIVLEVTAVGVKIGKED